MDDKALEIAFAATFPDIKIESPSRERWLGKLQIFTEAYHAALPSDYAELVEYHRKHGDINVPPAIEALEADKAELAEHILKTVAVAADAVKRAEAAESERDENARALIEKGGLLGTAEARVKKLEQMLRAEISWRIPLTERAEAAEAGEESVTLMWDKEKDKREAAEAKAKTWENAFHKSESISDDIQQKYEAAEVSLKDAEITLIAAREAGTENLERAKAAEAQVTELEKMEHATINVVDGLCRCDICNARREGAEDFRERAANSVQRLTMLGVESAEDAQTIFVAAIRALPLTTT